MKPTIEFDSRAAIERYQEELLQSQLLYLKQHSPFYKQLFEDNQIEVRDVRALKDLQHIPFTSKDDLQRYNDAFLCVPLTKVVDYSTTSGTLGDPVTFGLTDADLDRLAHNEMKSFQCAGVQPGDIVQLMTTMDRRFMAGLAYFLGVRKLGASIIRVGSGIPELQWDSILKYNPKYLIVVPSFLLKLIEYAEKNGIDYEKSSVRAAICIGESLRTAELEDAILTSRIKEKWDIELFSTYASTEMGAAFTECAAFQGGHVQPDLIITEIVDDDGNPVSDGQVGELVVTTLGVEALPLLRFRTGDMVRKHVAPCSCGRSTYRIGPVEGRKQHMIKYKGTTLYPPAMHDLLASFPELELHLIEITDNEIGTDEINIRIATKDVSEDFLNTVKDHFRAKLRVAPRIFVEQFEDLHKIVFNPLNRKPTTFIDKRRTGE
jgi:phenylacetate-CoA ligase